MEDHDGSDFASASDATTSSPFVTEEKDGYEQEPSDVSMYLREYLPWLKKQEESSDGASFALFVEHFEFVDLEDAKAAYETLIKSSRLRGDRRRVLQVKYETFLRNKLRPFWASHLLNVEKRETRINLQIAVTKSARVVQTSSAREIAATAKSLECSGDQNVSAHVLKSKRKIKDGLFKENRNKRQETMPKSKENDVDASISMRMRNGDSDTDDATLLSEVPLSCFDLGRVSSAQERRSLPQKKRKQQQQGEEILMYCQVFFDLTTIATSQLMVEGIDIGAAFRLLQEEAAPVVNDVERMLTLDRLPHFLAANHTWDATYQLPGIPEDDHDAIQASLCFPVVRLPDQLVLFCRSLLRDLTSKGYIRSRDTRSREEDAFLVLFQQASQKLPVRFLPFKHLRNEDTHAHSVLDSLLTFVFPAYHQRYELHWANRASDGSGKRRNGDAFKPDATVIKDGFELGFMEVKPPREDRHQRAYLEDVWALSGFAKDNIDLHLRHSRILTTASCVLVFGFQMTLYQLSFQAGIYIWQAVHTSYLPKDRYDSGNMVECVELIKTFKAIMDEADTGRYVHTPTKAVEDDEELPALFRPRPTNITPSTRPLFGHARRPSGST
ncbi:hypothetical protein EC991_007455 [Linnemannia zychae]|nr:hypothetical protein EC991_007455 [Linnemannia zychae]